MKTNTQRVLIFLYGIFMFGLSFVIILCGTNIGGWYKWLGVIFGAIFMAIGFNKLDKSTK